MRHPFFLRLAFALRGWSSQIVDPTAEPLTISGRVSSEYLAFGSPQRLDSLRKVPAASNRGAAAAHQSTC